MPKRDRYPAGVPSFIETTQPEPEAAVAFYRDLFGWQLTDLMPPDAPGHYFEARLDGGRVAAVSSRAEFAPPGAAWNMYVATVDADETAAKVRTAGGTVISEPFDVFEAGRMAAFADPEGARFCVWQAGRTTGSEVVNVPGSWNFSELKTRDLEAAQRFYGAVFGWEFDHVDLGAGPSSMVRMPGYGDYLESIDPGVRRRHREGGAPPGFTDAVGWFQPLDGDGPAYWNVTLAVDDADATAARARELGGDVLLEPIDIPWSRTAVLRDPQGATFTISQFKPPQ
jgi:predicted enzyme related to lactoylglutathione lyase